MNKQQLKQLEADLWRSADTLRANSDLKSSKYSTTVLGLIFLKFANNKYQQFEKAIVDEYATLKGTRREKPLSGIAIEKCGFYLPDHARYDFLLHLPSNMFYTVTLPATLWFFDKAKTDARILFIDARNIFMQINRAHREL